MFDKVCHGASMTHLRTCVQFVSNNDFMKLAAAILPQAKLNFENVCESLGNNVSFY